MKPGYLIYISWEKHRKKIVFFYFKKETQNWKNQIDKYNFFLNPFKHISTERISEIERFWILRVIQCLTDLIT